MEIMTVTGRKLCKINFVVYPHFGSRDVRVSVPKMVWVQETTYIGALFHIGFSHPNFPAPTATMVKKWVNDSFKSILQDNCQAYLDSNDLGKHKTRTQLINDVAEKIREAAPGFDLPGDLNKVRGVEIATEKTPNNSHSPLQPGLEMKQSELLGMKTLPQSLK